jgi:superkiller protein 3
MVDTISIRNILSSALLKLGRFEEAIIEYRKILSTNPNDINVLNKLGYALAHSGKSAEAVKEYEKILNIAPQNAIIHNILGAVFLQQGKSDEAVAEYRKSLQIKPDDPNVLNALGIVLSQQGKIDEAIAHFEWVLKIKPDWVGPMNNIAWFLAASEKTTAHNPDKAVRFAQRACELTNYKNPGLLDTLAVAYAAAGDFSKAIETAEEALELCRTPEQNTLKKEIENRLVLYKAGKPYIEAR